MNPGLDLGALPEAEVEAGPVTVMCGHGERAMTAASLLAARGHREVSVLAGGPADSSNAISSHRVGEP